MAYFAKSDAPIALVEKPDAPPTPPLVIWGPGDPRPTVPIAGPGRPPNWGMANDPGYGIEVTPIPPQIWGPTDPRPTVPIAEPPWGWGGTPPKPPVDPVKNFEIKYLWTAETGWITVILPTGAVVTPSKK
jgi:hypothetical protein